jgi:hypothetical protein
MHICTRLLKLSFSLIFMIYEKNLVISADNINLLITRTDEFDLQRKIINIRRELEILCGNLPHGGFASSHRARLCYDHFGARQRPRPARWQGMLETAVWGATGWWTWRYDSGNVDGSS